MPRTTIRLGSTGPEVSFLQKCLKDRNIYGGTVDGNFGQVTKKAVEAFQRSKGLNPDGICGRLTWELIEMHDQDIRPPVPPDIQYDFSSKEGTISAIKTECIKQGIGLPTQQAYVLATVYWETGKTFKPVREAYYVSNDFDKAEAYRKKNFRYYPYYGRGYVQLTWKANYQKYSDILGIDLVKNPDLALDPYNSLLILVHGFRTGAFTGKKISDYINQTKTDFRNARRCINGLDKCDTIAALARKYLEDIS